MAKPLPSIEQLRSLLDYDIDTGVMRWRPRPRDMFVSQNSFTMWNTRYAGKEAFTSVDDHGYRQGGIFGQRRLAHRVIWALVHGEWPVAIDHINGVRTDNRLCNMRNVDRQTNQQNMKRFSTNKTGVVGVWKDSRSQKWRASIHVGKTRDLGLYHCFGQAFSARRKAQAAAEFHANHGRAA